VTRTVATLGVVTCALALAAPALVRAQDKPAGTLTAKPPAAHVPLKIQVVISRYQGDKKISSLPYSLSITGGGGNVAENMAAGPSFIGRANLRMGAKVPVAATSYTPIAAGGAGVNPLVSYQYQDVGTNIDCHVWSVDDGRFRVEITIEDSSVYPDDKEIPGTVKGNPSFRSFRGSDSMLLKDGGTAQFTTATDKVSGETVRVDVTLTVVK
jgi:hypothetical protein